MKRIASLLFLLLQAAGPAAASAAGTPGKIVLGVLSFRYEPVAFDHAGHARTAGGCNDCHHQHGTNPALSCGGCHGLDTAAFRRAIGVSKFRPCRDCHPLAPRRDEPAAVPLAAAYHRACFHCHGGEVGTVGTDPKGCTEMCHSRKEKDR